MSKKAETWYNNDQNRKKLWDTVGNEKLRTAFNEIFKEYKILNEEEDDAKEEYDEDYYEFFNDRTNQDKQEIMEKSQDIYEKATNKRVKMQKKIDAFIWHMKALYNLVEESQKIKSRCLECEKKLTKNDGERLCKKCTPKPGGS